MVDHALEPARARASGYDRGVDGPVAGRRLRPGRMIYGLTSWTSWTTSHNASRGRRQTPLVDVDYGRKPTSHKGVKRPRAPGERCLRSGARAKPSDVAYGKRRDKPAWRWR